MHGSPQAAKFCPSHSDYFPPFFFFFFFLTITCPKTEFCPWKFQKKFISVFSQFWLQFLALDLMAHMRKVWASSSCLAKDFFSHKDSWLSGLSVCCSYVLNVLVYDGCFFLHFTIFKFKTFIRKLYFMLKTPKFGLTLMWIAFLVLTVDIFS